MELLELVQRLLQELEAWRRDPRPRVPVAIQEMIDAIDQSEARTEIDGLIGIAVATLQENLRAFDQPEANRMFSNGDRQPDGGPGPRLWATVDLIRQRVSRAVELASPVPLSPCPPVAERVTPMAQANRLTNLLNELNSTDVDEIDKEIALLQEQIDALHRLRNLIQPPPAKAKQGTRRTKEEIDQLAADIATVLTSDGPLTAGKIAKKVDAVVSTVQRLLENGRFKKAKDGTWSVA